MIPKTWTKETPIEPTTNYTVDSTGRHNPNDPYPGDGSLRPRPGSVLNEHTAVFDAFAYHRMGIVMDWINLSYLVTTLDNRTLEVPYTVPFNVIGRLNHTGRLLNIALHIREEIIRNHDVTPWRGGRGRMVPTARREIREQDNS